MFTTSSLLLTALFALVPYVSAHGFVAKVTIDGKSYDGNVTRLPIRSISANGPVKSVTDPNLACGLGSVPGTVIAAANPGSTIAFHWISGSLSGMLDWMHKVGPVLTYMAKCDGTTCDKFDATKAQWFKIAQDGMANSSTWVQGEITVTSPYTTKIPENLEAGQYLIRSELISLQGAMSPGGAEFYPSCTQLNIGGNGNLVPNATTGTAELYHADDKGICVDVYTPNGPYVMPGPPVAALVPDNGQSSDGPDASPPASSQTDASAAPSASSVSTGTVSVADNGANQCTCANTQPADSSSGTDATAQSSATVTSTSPTGASDADNAQSTSSDDSATVAGVATTASNDAASPSSSSSAASANECGQPSASRRRRFVRRSGSSGRA
ncbi:lytic polysaccharide monooxygenase [Trametes sanguinea]|nr:lytic polysaccharide monooxygenase [Trametes sanguinea]